MSKKLELNLLPDKPVLKADPTYYEFYHDYISPALQKLIRENRETSTIGLFGDWGSGKSTIIDNLKEDFSDYPVFVFDAWKYQHDPLRRTFLIKLQKFIHNNNLWKDKEFVLNDDWLDDLYSDEEIRIEMPKTNEEDEIRNLLVRLWKKIISLFKKRPLFYLLISVSFIALVLWLASQIILSDSHPVIRSILQINGIVIGISGLVAFTVYEASKKTIELVTTWILEDLKGDINYQTHIKKREHLNSPEQFEKKFKELIEHIGSNLVIVFDNIDRVNPDLAIETLSTIKTFFNPSERDLTEKIDKQIVFVIPCDSAAILDRIKLHYEIDDDYKASEYLRKLFNVSVWTPEFISSDIEDFIRKTIPQLGNDASKLDDEYLFIVLNQTFGSRANPREIKQFLNNLVATLHIANGTAVREIVLGNIPYMAKVLALRQKFPRQYLRLKKSFFEPEKIWGDKTNPEFKEDPPEFNEFMLNTSIVTVVTAEPFIYFKKPNQSKYVKNDEELTKALLSEDYDLTKKIIEENKEVITPLVNFVLGLYKKYKAYPELLFNLIKTFVQTSAEVGITIPGSSYYNETADIIYKHIWSKYRELDTKLIFGVFINNPQTHKDFRVQLIDRYIAAISSEELNDKIDEVTVILSELISTEINSDTQIQKIRSIIASQYSQEPQIIELFEDFKKQARYITNKTVTSYIETIDIDNFGEKLFVLLNYKAYINYLGLTPDLSKKLEDIITKDHPNNLQGSDTNKNLFSLVDKFIYEPDSILPTAGIDSRGNLLTAVISYYANSGVLDTRYYIIPALDLLKKDLEEPKFQTQVTTANNYINQFISQATIDSLHNLIDYLAEIGRDETFVNEYVSAFVSRAISNGAEEITFCYDRMGVNERQAVLNGIIENRIDAGLGFVEKLNKLPKRNETIAKYLDRATKLQPQDRGGIYNWITQNLKINDDTSLKNEAIFQIKHLLTHDVASYQEAAYNFLESASFVNETQKRDIGDVVLEWFRTPGKSLNQNHRFAIKSIATLFPTLDLTRRAYFVYELFKMLSNNPDRLVAEVALESLIGIGVRAKDHKDYFIDFKENFKTWPESDVKQYVKEEFMKLKPLACTKYEKEYWKEMQNLP